MPGTLVAGSETRILKDSRLKERLQELRKTDNWTNWFYLLRAYLFLALVIGGYVWFDQWRAANGLAWWWSVPVALLAILFIGAGQHQLSGLAHEAVHHILFRNRYLNDVVSDWLCMFPLFSSTHHYRLQHLAHHQFVNDPQRDPDISQLQTSGHWLDFPLGKKHFLWTLVKQIWPFNLIRYIRVRAAYNATGTDKNPYMRKGVKLSKLALRIGLVYLLLEIVALIVLVHYGDPVWLAVVPLSLYLVVQACFYCLPDSKYHKSRIHPVIASRWMTLLRITYLTLLFNTLAWITYLTGRWAAGYYLLLWLVPLFTSFSFFMILRQLVQHGNGGRGWLTNTRIFFVSPFIRFSVFPIGQDYHLPHHLFATIPHYRLHDLHQALLVYPEYQEQAVEVHGYFFSPEHPQRHPTVLDVIGPAYAPTQTGEVYLDHTVLENDEVDDKDEIIQEGESEQDQFLDDKTEPAANS
jgi:fatty acid desaturase